MLKFKEWEYNNITLHESLAQNLAGIVMYKMKYRKVKFDHVANEALFASSIENFFQMLLEIPEIKEHKYLIKNNKIIKEKIIRIMYKYAHKVKNDLNRMGHVRLTETSIIETLKNNMIDIQSEINRVLASK